MEVRCFWRGLLAACSGFEESLAQDAVATFHLVLTLGDSCVEQLLAYYELLRAGGLPHGAILAVQAQSCRSVLRCGAALVCAVGGQGEEVGLRAY